MQLCMALKQSCVKKLEQAEIRPNCQSIIGNRRLNNNIFLFRRNSNGVLTGAEEFMV